MESEGLSDSFGRVSSCLGGVVVVPFVLTGVTLGPAFVGTELANWPVGSKVGVQVTFALVPFCPVDQELRLGGETEVNASC